MTATWPSGTARRLKILRDGHDSRLEPFAFDIISRVAANSKSQSSLRSLSQLLLNGQFTSVARILQWGWKSKCHYI